MPEHPRVRETELTVQPLGDELLIFDATANRAHSLNPTATAIWSACDGTRSPDQIAAHTQLDPVAVQLSLQQLTDAKLLNDYTPPEHRISRRHALQRLALTGAGLGIALPVIRSIVAPSVAAAASGGGRRVRNGARCFSSSSGHVLLQASCSSGSSCLEQSAGASFSIRACLRKAGTSCYYSSAVDSNTSLCASGFRCPSNGTCPT